MKRALMFLVVLLCFSLANEVRIPAVSSLNISNNLPGNVVTTNYNGTVQATLFRTETTTVNNGVQTSSTITANKLTDGTWSVSGGSVVGGVNGSFSGTLTANKLVATTTVNAVGGYYSGNVGIGTTAPNTKLEVNGTVSASALQVNGVATAYSGFDSYTGSNVGRAKLDNGGGGGGAQLLLWDANGSVNNAFGQGSVGYNNNLNANGGNTGIGFNTPNTPNTKLEVNGTVSASALKANGDVTLTGKLSGVTMSMSAMPYINTYVNGHSNINTGGTITFNAVSAVVGNITVNMSTGVITVKEAGTYLIISQVRWNAQTTGTYRQNTIQKNGASTELANKYSSNAFLGGDTTNPSWVGTLAVNDTISCWVNADGTGLQLNGGSATSTFIMVQRLF